MYVKHVPPLLANTCARISLRGATQHKLVDTTVANTTIDGGWIVITELRAPRLVFPCISFLLSVKYVHLMDWNSAANFHLVFSH